MSPAKRVARARRRAKTLRLVRQFNIPFWRSRWSLYSNWRPPEKGLTPGDVQSARKLARREAS